MPRGDGGLGEDEPTRILLEDRGDMIQIMRRRGTRGWLGSARNGQIRPISGGLRFQRGSFPP